MLLTSTASLEILPKNRCRAVGNTLVSVGGTILCPSAYLQLKDDQWEGLFFPPAVQQMELIDFLAAAESVRNTLEANSGLPDSDVASVSYDGAEFFVSEGGGFLTSTEAELSGKIQVDCGGGKILIVAPIEEPAQSSPFPGDDQSMTETLVSLTTPVFAGEDLDYPPPYGEKILQAQSRDRG